MDKPTEDLLAKVSPDRRRFVQSILGLAGYGAPVVRSFMMASAIVPAFAAPVTTTPTPTTTRSAWRPGAHSLPNHEGTGSANPHPILSGPHAGSGDLLKHTPAQSELLAKPHQGGDLLGKPNSSNAGDSLIKQNPNRDPRKH